MQKGIRQCYRTLHQLIWTQWHLHLIGSGTWQHFRKDAGTDDAGDVSIFSTSGDTLPPSSDKLAAEMVDLRVEMVELRAELRSEFQQKHDELRSMFRAFMEKSNEVATTVKDVASKVETYEKHVQDKFCVSVENEVQNKFVSVEKGAGKKGETSRTGPAESTMANVGGGTRVCMDPAERELQMRDMDSKFRYELEKIQNNESGERTKFQVEMWRRIWRNWQLFFKNTRSPTKIK